MAPKKSAPSKAQAKYPAGALKLHHSIATGESLQEAQSEKRVGGSKSDKSQNTNK